MKIIHNNDKVIKISAKHHEILNLRNIFNKLGAQIDKHPDFLVDHFNENYDAKVHITKTDIIAWRNVFQRFLDSDEWEDCDED